MHHAWVDFTCVVLLLSSSYIGHINVMCHALWQKFSNICQKLGLYRITFSICWVPTMENGLEFRPGILIIITHVHIFPGLWKMPIFSSLEGKRSQITFDFYPRKCEKATISMQFSNKLSFQSCISSLQPPPQASESLIRGEAQCGGNCFKFKSTPL